MAVLVLTASVLLLLFSFASYAPWTNLLFDLPSHFVLQYAIGAVILLLLAFWFKSHPAVLAMLFFSLCLNLWQIREFPPRKPSKFTEAAIKILQANALVLNTDATLLRNLIENEKPDIILVSEVNSVFKHMFRDLLEAYPHQAIISRDDSAYGLAVLSKIPLESIGEVNFDQPYIPAQIVRFKQAEEEFSLISIHPANPLGDIESRNREFEKIAEWFQKNAPKNAILVGDFNATPYCAALKKLQRTTGLVNARTGKGLLGSWPSWMPAFSRIPIDHLLTSPHIPIPEHRTGPFIGSDHLPLISTLSLKQ